ncbi:MAG: exodeoxyribonuclease III [Rickettsiales bacterium]|nr:exodeoxyribonuclease III [Rickettsiales bacterium]
MLIIASWNVNSIRTRYEHVQQFFDEINPDVLMVQEIKCLEEEFPEFYKKQYNVFICGEKGKYGVATFIKKNLDAEKIEINDSILNQEARIILIKIKNLDLNLVNVYTPNGNPIEKEEKFKFKISWINRLINFTEKFVENNLNCVIGGDFNVIDNKFDAKNFDEWKDDALGHSSVRDKFRELLSKGYLNTIRLFKKPGQYSFWDYQQSSWERNNGILIDHILISPKLTKKIISFKIEEKFRGLKKPSDHVPIWIRLE